MQSLSLPSSPKRSQSLCESVEAVSEKGREVIAAMLWTQRKALHETIYVYQKVLRERVFCGTKNQFDNTQPTPSNVQWQSVPGLQQAPWKAMLQGDCETMQTLKMPNCPQGYWDL